jgi:predicted transcriptional regulator of viral defense system
MISAQQAILEYAQSRGILRSRDLESKGLSRVELARLVRAGKLTCLSRGLYTLPDRDVTEHSTLAEVAIKIPKSIFCLMTALYLHQLTTQSPHEVWIALASNARRPGMDYPPLKVVRFSEETLEYGVENKVIDSVVSIAVTSIEKTIADCFKFRSKVGLDVAIESLHEAWRDKRINMDELWRCAVICRVSNVMRPYLDSLPKLEKKLAKQG